MSQLKEEEKLIKQAKQGDDFAFTELFQRYYSFLFHYLIKLCLDSGTAEDIIQETMLKAYTNLSTFKQNSKFSTWLIAIASRTFIDYKRREKKHQKRVEKAHEQARRQLDWQASLKGFEWSDYFDRFSALDHDTSVLLVLKYYYEYTYKEIAEMFHLREGTVKTRIFYGIKKIREECRE